MENILTTEQVAKILSVDVTTIYGLVKKKIIPHVKLTGKILRFKENEIQKWIDDNRVVFNKGNLKKGVKYL